MKSILTASLLSPLLLVLPLAAHAAVSGDPAAGQRLHDANCTACHDSGVYTRKNRTVQSLSGLQQQLEDCGHATQKTFSADERQNIVRYLNDRFYLFP